MPLLPGIQPNSKTEIFTDERGTEVGRITYLWVDGNWSEEAEGGDPERGELGEVTYTLAVVAVNDRAAQRKAQGYAMVQHPSESLQISTEIETVRSHRGAMFGSSGPRNMYMIEATVGM